MIVAERKPFAEIIEFVDTLRKVLLLGCGGCVTVCLAGGEKEVGILATQLTLARQKEGRPLDIVQKTVARQCDAEYLQEIKELVEDVDGVLSMACGVGVQMVAEVFPEKVVFPALDTKFVGANLGVGVWAERCQCCGQCLLGLTGGICPIARCAKSLLNGPCGGSQNGRCEISEDIDCAWQLIYDRLAKLNRLDVLRQIVPPKDWSFSRDGGPRKLVREELEVEG